MKKNSIILKRRAVIIESCQIWKIVSIFLSQDDSYVWKIHNKGTSINYVPAVLKTLSEVLSSIIEYLAREFSIPFQQNDFYKVLLWAPPNATHFPSLSKVPVALDSVILVHLQARFSKLTSRTLSSVLNILPFRRVQLVTIILDTSEWSDPKGDCLLLKDD